jgi:hypothetical protein
MDRGHRWQEPISVAITALTGLEVAEAEACVEHPDDARWRCTLDGLLYAAGELPVGVAEVKTRGVDSRPDRDRWTDQVQWQLLCTGLDRAVLAEAVIDDVSDACLRLYLTEVAADQFRQQHLIDVAEGLWQHYEDGTLPAPDTPSALDAVKELTAASDGTPEVDLDEWAPDVERLFRIKAGIKAAEQEAAMLEAQVRAAIGTADGGRCAGYEVKVAQPDRKVPPEVAAAFAQAHPQYAVVKLDTAALRKADEAAYDRIAERRGARKLTIKEIHS